MLTSRLQEDLVPELFLPSELYSSLKVTCCGVDRPQFVLGTPIISWSRSPAAKGGQHLVEVIWPLQDVPRFGTFAWPDNTPALQQVHQPAGLREADPELALEHRCRPELRGHHQLGPL